MLQNELRCKLKSASAHMDRSGFSGIWQVQYTVTVSGPNFCRQVMETNTSTAVSSWAAGATAAPYNVRLHRKKHSSGRKEHAGLKAACAQQHMQAGLLQQVPRSRHRAVGTRLTLVRTEKWKRL